MSQFKSLKIEKERWGKDAGKLIGTLDIGGEKGSLSLNIPEYLCDQILQLAKTAIIDGVEQTANDFIFEITTAIPDIPLLGNANVLAPAGKKTPTTKTNV